MDTFPPQSWSTNLPNGYLDTRYLDDSGEKSYAVGTASVAQIQPNTTYSFTMVAYPNNNNNYEDRIGLWSINFQRGYWLDSTNWYYVNFIRGTGDEWYVFNEEYETTAKIKQYHKYNSQYYTPSGFNSSTATTHATQFRYKEGFNVVSNGSIVDTGNIPSQGYQVYKLQVNTAATYRMKTTKYGSVSSDTYLHLYDHNFTEIASNDDYNGTLYSQIDRYLAKGDYYIVVRGYGWNQMRSYLNVSIP
jgi:hypothetical protein